MNAIRIIRRLNSQILDMPELAPLIGQQVEIIVLQEEAAPVEPPPGPKAGSGKGQGWMAPDFDETPETDPADSRSPSPPEQSNFGCAKGHVWMAPDFDDTPEGFAEYM